MSWREYFREAELADCVNRAVVSSISRVLLRMSLRQLPTSESTSITNQIKLKSDINNYEHKTFKITEEGSQEMLLNGLRQVYETKVCSEVQSGNYYLCHVNIAMLAHL
jgi:hypothetical protein